MESQGFFFLFWLFNFLVIRLFGLLFPGMVVLGNFRLTEFDAALYSGFWLTFFVWTMRDYMSARKVKYDPPVLMHYYFLFLNVFGVWIISRYGAYTGLGIVSFWWTLILGAVTYLFQLLTWFVVERRLKG